MTEKEVSIEDSFQVWWFIVWKTVLVVFVINIILSLLVKFIGVSLYGLENTVSIILGILAQVFFLKTAINRNYKNFRLLANSLAEDTTFAPSNLEQNNTPAE